MDPEEEWNQWADDEVYPHLVSSAYVMTLSPGEKPDPKIALETGYAVLLNKPILVVGWPGHPIPPGLRRIAHKVIELEDSLTSLTGQAQMQEALRQMMEETDG